MCFILVLVVAALLLSVAPATLVLTVGFLAITLTLLGLLPLLLTPVLGAA